MSETKKSAFQAWNREIGDPCSCKHNQSGAGPSKPGIPGIGLAASFKHAGITLTGAHSWLDGLCVRKSMCVPTAGLLHVFACRQDACCVVADGICVALDSRSWGWVWLSTWSACCMSDKLLGQKASFAFKRWAPGLRCNARNGCTIAAQTPGFPAMPDRARLACCLYTWRLSSYGYYICCGSDYDNGPFTSSPHFWNSNLGQLPHASFVQSRDSRLESAAALRQSNGRNLRVRTNTNHILFCYLTCFELGVSHQWLSGAGNMWPSTSLVRAT